MNIKQAKTIQIISILDKLGHQPTKITTRAYWYKSPFREENTASFKVNIAKNLWIDYGTGIGGDIISFAQEYLKHTGENHTIPDALRWLKNLSGSGAFIQPIDTPYPQEGDVTLVLRKVEKLSHPALIKYLEKRRITYSLASKYLKQVYVFNKESGKTFFALGLKNEDDGYELRNPGLKSCIGPKTVTIIQKEKPQPYNLHIFEGMMDFLSAMERNQIEEFDDVAILNSLSCLEALTPYIKNYGYKIAFTWTDNDTAGLKAKKALGDFCNTEENLTHKPMNKIYYGYKDVNEWHMIAPSDETEPQ